MNEICRRKGTHQQVIFNEINRPAPTDRRAEPNALRPHAAPSPRASSATSQNREKASLAEESLGTAEE